MTPKAKKREDLLQVGFRVPLDLLKRVDAYAARRSAELGCKVTRTDAIRMILHRAFEEKLDR